MYGIRRLECGHFTFERREHWECLSTASVSLPQDPSFQPEEPSQSGRKQWSEEETQKAKRRGKVFLTFSMAIAIPLFCIMLAIFPIVWLFDRARRRAEHWINKIWAKWSTGPFNKVTVRMLDFAGFQLKSVHHLLLLVNVHFFCKVPLL
jgi:hypothetical protein